MNNDSNKRVLDDLVRLVYGAILANANRFLTHSEKFPIQLLAKENPSYQDVANLINGARLNIHEVMDDFDPMLAQQAEEYCHLMIRIAHAIKSEDEAALRAYCVELARKPFAMPA